MYNFPPSIPNFLPGSSSFPPSVTKQGLCWLGNKNIKLVNTVSKLSIIIIFFFAFFFFYL